MGEPETNIGTGVKKELKVAPLPSSYPSCRSFELKLPLLTIHMDFATSFKEEMAFSEAGNPTDLLLPGNHAPTLQAPLPFCIL